MFWLKRRTADEVEASWAVPYGDLMSLLLAVFVMIAAMSEIRSPHRFNQVSGAVRSAFGFSRAASPMAAPAGIRPPTLIERLERAGFTRASSVRLVGPNDRLFAGCEVFIEPDRITVRLAGDAAFNRYSAVLAPGAEQAARRMAEMLVEGRNRIEVRGFSGDGPLPAGVPFRDGLDLSYARARAAAMVLTREGVAPDRIHVTAWGDRRPAAAARATAAADRCVEIVVDAVPADAHDQFIAEEDRVQHD